MVQRGDATFHSATGADASSPVEKAARSGRDDVFYVGDLGVIREQIRAFRRHLPRVTPYYAVKCNPDAEVLKMLAGLGVGFDIASLAELEMIRTILGNDAAQVGARVIYANPVKSAASLGLATSYGVSLLVFDSMYELEKIGGSTAATEHKARLVLRIAVDDSTSLVPLAEKFGAKLCEVPALLEKAYQLNLDVVGVAFHVGSGAKSLKPYISAIKDAKAVFEMAASTGYYRFNVLDIGGGFPGHDNESPITFREISRVVDKHVRQLFAGPTYEDLEIIAEPGRFIVAAAFSLAAKVVGAREGNFDGDADIDSNATKMEYVIADGIYGSFKDALLLHANYRVEVLLAQDAQREENDAVASTVFGPSLDRFDVVLRNKMMRKMMPGDWIVFRNMGAYTISLASQLGAIPPPPVYYLR